MMFFIAELKSFSNTVEIGWRSSMDIEIIEPKAPPSKHKKRDKAKARWTFYRDDKSAMHRTINGKGIIARLTD